jgi:TonB-linked SusC/RagA family outer membrane protein
MKKYETTAFPGVRPYLKIALIMKLTVVFLLIACLQVSARGWSQERITLKMNGAEIKKVLFAIEKKSNYRFLFNESSLKGKPKVTVEAVETPITDVLDKILSNTGISYKILGSHLVVLKEGVEATNITTRDIRVSGKVTSSTGEALSGVSVTVKGSRTGTTTDGNGNFSLTVPDDAVLVFSYVGFESVEVAVAGKSTVDVSLKQSERVQDAVVVIGYGTASKRDLTGSITKVSGKEVADKPNTNPVASLQGKVAGLSVVNSGIPGQEPDIRIRGTVSLFDTKPLYVVDGIFNDNINYVNPGDIESIEVLKDPSSLAIFGVRGANGVIIVTTKKGKSGKITVNLNSSVGFKRIVDIPELTDANGFKTLYDEQRANQGAAPFSYYNLFQGNTNWVKEIENKNAIINVNNISISSGTDKNKFYMGVGYTKEEGLIRHENLDKVIITLNDELKVSKNIKLGFNVVGARSWLPQIRGFSGALIATPIVEPFNTTFGVYNKLPEEIGGPQIGNPLMGVEAAKHTQIAREQRIAGSVFAEFNFLRKFTFRANLLTDVAFSDTRRYTPLINVYAAEINAVAPQAGFTRTAVNQNKNSSSKYQQDYLLTYKNQFGDHGLTAMAGFTTYFQDLEGLSGIVQQYTTRDPIPYDKRFWYVNVFPYGDPTTRLSSSAQWERATASGLFRALYNYKGKYLLNASFRRDGSSEISPLNRSDNFWAVGAAWEMSKENFMSTQKVFDYFKVKASIGKLGNQINSVNYPYYPNLQEGPVAVFGELIVPAYVQAYINTPDLRWETVRSYEGGIELDALKRRLHFEANYYNKTTRDLLVFVNEGTAARFYRNSGEIENKGFEFLATWSDRTKSGIGYSITGNLTTIKNTVKSIFREGYEIPGDPSITEAGFPVAYFYGYVHDGIYQSIADKLGSPDASALGDYGPGDIKFKDINNDGVINEDDRTLIGNPTPDFTYAITGNINYKGFDLSADFQGVYGNEIWRSWGNGNSFAQFNYRAARLERWNGAGTSNWEPQVNDLAAINRLSSTYMIEDGSYIRLRNLQLGYTFSGAWMSKLHITALRIYVNGQNLKTWKKNSGFTPEAGGTPTSFGIDGGGYPIPAITTFGFNVTF